MDLSWERTAHDALCSSGCLDETLEIDTRTNTHSLEHVDEVFRRNVARGAWSVRASPEPANRSIEVTNTELEANDDIGERRSSRVVHVHGDGGLWKSIEGAAN